MKMKNRARNIVAYGMAPAVIRYCPRRKMPTWEVRSPMETYPSLDRIPGTTQPVDVIFAYRRSVAWLRANGYGWAVSEVTGRFDTGADSMMLMLEYVDEECACLCVAGYVDGYNYLYGGSPYVNQGVTGMKAVLLECVETEGVMTASVPTRLTLNRPGGQFDAMIGMYYAQAKLMALEVLAVEKGVFPDVYLESRAGELARFIDGPYDGRTGQVNIVAGGVIREQANSPGYMTPQTIDRLERAQRVTAGIPAEFGGESGTNIRTGRRGDAVPLPSSTSPSARPRRCSRTAWSTRTRPRSRSPRCTTGARPGASSSAPGTPAAPSPTSRRRSSPTTSTWCPTRWSEPT